MYKNIWQRELKVNFKTTLIWTIALTLFIILGMAMYPTYSSESLGMQQIMNSMPKSLLTAFEMDKLNMTDILQYYGMYASVYITLFSSIFAIMLSSNILAKEEADKTIEFLLARPVSRAEVVTGKLLNYLFYIFILNIIITIVSYISLEVLKKDNYSLQVFLILALASFLAQLTFANLGFLISLFIKNKKSINSIGIGLVLGMYFLGVVSRISDKIIFLSYFTPFQYASPSDIISEGRIKLAYIIIIAIVNIASIAGTYFVYNKRDINV